MTVRTGCLIPLCKRTTSKQYDCWICAVHWSAIPVRRRRVYSRAKARFKRYPTVKNMKSSLRLWRLMIRMATDRAFL